MSEETNLRELVDQPYLFTTTNTLIISMRWLQWINLLLVLAIVFTGSLFFFHFPNQGNIAYSPCPQQTRPLPKSPFTQSEEAFHEIGENVFKLNWVPPQMHLPDLRNEIIFLGKNNRPDNRHTCFLISLKSSNEHRSINEGERVYLIYKGSFGEKNHSLNGRGSYVFSPKGQTSPLWIKMQSVNENNVEIEVNMFDEKGTLVTKPSELHTFLAHALPLSRSQVNNWNIGGFRADSTLLVRQKARWAGPDLFFEMHGGDDYAYANGRERIDFFDRETPYACFVNENDFMVWKDDHWEVAQENESTQNLPLLAVKKIEDKVMNLELWSPDGKSKVVLTLIRAREREGLPVLSEEFKFVGAKTWAQFIVESPRNGRMILKPHDWLVLTQEGWKKLDSPEEIDEYVAQKVTGPLFVLDKLTKENGRQVLVGHIFNTARTHVEQVELAATPNQSLANYYRALPANPPLQCDEELEGQIE